MSTNRIAMLIVALAMAVAASVPAGSAAHAQDAQQSIEAGREAFGDGDFPWYDSETDSLKPLEFHDRPKRQSSSALGQLLSIIAWTSLAALLIGLVVLLIYFARNQSARALTEPTAQSNPLLDADQIEALPFMAQRRRDDLLGQARYHYQQGNYSEAIIYLFSYQLLELDKVSVIRLAKGKTNRQYLRETSRIAALRTALERTMHSFEGVFFGRRPLDRASFEACWNSLPEFEQQLRGVT